jgi:hypothetical protein
MTALAIAAAVGVVILAVAAVTRRHRPPPTLGSRLLAAHIAQATRRL